MKNKKSKKSVDTLSKNEVKTIEDMTTDFVKDEVIHFTVGALIPKLVVKSIRNPVSLFGSVGKAIGTAIGIPTFDNSIANTVIATAGSVLGPIGALATTTIAPVITDAVMDLTNTRSHEPVRDAYEACYGNYIDGRRAGTLSAKSLDLAKVISKMNINNKRFSFDKEAQALLDYIQTVTNGVPKERAVSIVNAHLKSNYTSSDIDKLLSNPVLVSCLVRYSKAIQAILKSEYNKSFFDKIRSLVGMNNTTASAVIEAIDYATLGEYKPINIKENFSKYLQ